jgi:hypothetical protein
MRHIDSSLTSGSRTSARRSWMTSVRQIPLTVDCDAA